MNSRIRWKKIKQRGNIIWDNVNGIMRERGNIYLLNEDGSVSDEVLDTHPQTYTFDGVLAYNSYSALVPIGNKKNPHEFIYYDFDEDDCNGNGWVDIEVRNPLHWKTEKEFLESV